MSMYPSAPGAIIGGTPIGMTVTVVSCASNGDNVVHTAFPRRGVLVREAPTVYLFDDAKQKHLVLHDKSIATFQTLPHGVTAHDASGARLYIIKIDKLHSKAKIVRRRRSSSQTRRSRGRRSKMDESASTNPYPTTCRMATGEIRAAVMRVRVSASDSEGSTSNDKHFSFSQRPFDEEMRKYKGVPIPGDESSGSGLFPSNSTTAALIEMTFSSNPGQ